MSSYLQLDSIDIHTYFHFTLYHLRLENSENLSEITCVLGHCLPCQTVYYLYVLNVEKETPEEVVFDTTELAMRRPEMRCRRRQTR